jgi:hypothetical protein
VSLEDVDRQLRASVLLISADDRAFLLKTLTFDSATRAEVIGSLHATGLAPAAVELLIDAEEELALKALLVGLLRELDRE